MSKELHMAEHAYQKSDKNSTAPWLYNLKKTGGNFDKYWLKNQK